MSLARRQKRFGDHDQTKRISYAEINKQCFQCKYLLSIIKTRYIAIQNKSHSVENFFWKGVHCWLFEVKVSFQSRPCWRQNVSLLTSLEMWFSHKKKGKGKQLLWLGDMWFTLPFTFYKTLPILSFCFLNILNPDSLITLVTLSEL